MSQKESPSSAGVVREDASNVSTMSITAPALKPTLERAADVIDAPQAATKRYSQRHNHTTQKPIRMGMAKKRSYWIFEYRFQDDVALYVMRCPHEFCQNPVFSRHPLMRDRAATHLKACGQDFQNEREMVKRYAHLGEYQESIHLALVTI